MFLNKLLTFTVPGKLVNFLYFSILKHKSIKNKHTDGNKSERTET